MIDFALEKNSDGIFDFVLENGELKTVKGLNTAVTVSLFTNQRLTESEQSIDILRSGWWGNFLVDAQTPNFQMGSKLHFLKQARNDLDTRNLIRNFINQAFSWLVDDGFFKAVQVEIITLLVKGIEVEVKFVAFSGESEKKKIAIFGEQ